jgi:hypothetical protein
MVSLLQKGLEAVAGLLDALGHGLDLLLRAGQLGSELEIFATQALQDRMDSLQFVVQGVEFIHHSGMVSIPQAIIEFPLYPPDGSLSICNGFTQFGL